MKVFINKRSDCFSNYKQFSILTKTAVVLLILTILDFNFCGKFAPLVCSAKNFQEALAYEDSERGQDAVSAGIVNNGDLLFPDELSRFSTSFPVDDQINRNRAFNIRLVSSKINGKIIDAGDTFSFNAATGPRTDKLGYKPAWIYVDGKMIKDTGGGVCQVSSTLYNAVLLADLKILDRKNHMFAVSYVKKGMDATVFYGNQDFKFKNTLSSPIKIVSSVSKDNKLTFVLKGILEKSSKTVNYESKLVKSLPFTVIEKADPGLLKGKRIYEGHKGMNGYIVEVFKVYRDSKTGKVLSRTKLYTNSYKPYNSVVLVGTKTEVKPSAKPLPSAAPVPSPKPSPTPEPVTTPTPDFKESDLTTPSQTPSPAPLPASSAAPSPAPSPAPSSETESEAGSQSDEMQDAGGN